MSRQDSVEIAWLSARLGEKRSLMLDLFTRMRGLAGRFIPGGMKESLFPKFAALFTQIAEARDEEMRIINQIEDIEAKHRLRRHMGKLQRAAEPDAAPENRLNITEPEADKPKSGLLWIAALWYYMSSSKLSVSGQQLKND